MNSTGLYNSNRLGFRGVEYLGGGLKARFSLESGFSGGTAAGASELFGRQATVGLGGSWGAIDIGRQLSVSAKTISGYDPFSLKYLSIIPLARETIGKSSARFNNDVQYTGKFGNFTTRAEYVPGEVAGSTKTGTALATGGTYAAGPFSVGAAFTKWDDFGGIGFDRTQATIGAAYTIGATRIAGGYIDDKINTSGTDTTPKNTWIGVAYNFTPAIALTGAYYRTKGRLANLPREKNLLIVGATYAFSKRTNLHVEIDKNRFSGAAIVNGQTSQTGIARGLNHTF
ncbi:MAG: hypothetical protein A3E79_10715 [Burkholderiales bacterium RIFCSPHIGHO2_12_FULL_61_11]|nr:MAG: hypothetical protein A3E79_10715 [Burkholderiales bacterium RIFCSPHIGHO2_12_FULL_61_11]